MASKKKTIKKKATKRKTKSKANAKAKEVLRRIRANRAKRKANAVAKAKLAAETTPRFKHPKVTKTVIFPGRSIKETRYAGPAIPKGRARMDELGKSLCMNWPPSRGPEPKEPRFRNVFPEVTVTGPHRVRTTEAAEKREDDFFLKPVTESHWVGSPQRRYVDLSTWSYVKDLLTLSPDMAAKFLLGAELIPARAATKRRVERRASAHTVEMLPARTYTAELRYPFGSILRVKIKPIVSQVTQAGTFSRKKGWKRKEMPIGWVLWCLAKAYEHAYVEHEKYRIWGHSIRDLCFETLTIKDDKIYVGVGS